jgi:hypothetical protein
MKRSKMTMLSATSCSLQRVASCSPSGFSATTHCVAALPEAREQKNEKAGGAHRDERLDGVAVLFNNPLCEALRHEECLARLDSRLQLGERLGFVCKAFERGEEVGTVEAVAVAAAAWQCEGKTACAETQDIARIPAPAERECMRATAYRTRRNPRYFCFASCAGAGGLAWRGGRLSGAERAWILRKKLGASL